MHNYLDEGEHFFANTTAMYCFANTTGMYWGISTVAFKYNVNNSLDLKDNFPVPQTKVQKEQVNSWRLFIV